MISSSIFQIISNISSRFTEKSLFFLISLKSCFNPIDANGRLYSLCIRPGRIHKEYNLPFASMGLKEDLREIKKNKDFSAKREEILEMIWNMEEEIMGKEI